MVDGFGYEVWRSFAARAASESACTSVFTGTDGQAALGGSLGGLGVNTGVQAVLLSGVCMPSDGDFTVNPPFTAEVLGGDSAFAFFEAWVG